MKNEVSKTFCVLPWIQMRYSIGSFFSPCCISENTTSIDVLFQSELNDEKCVFNDYWNSEYMKNIRHDLMNGIQAKACEKCWKNEKNGVQSDRQRYLIRYGSEIADIYLSNTSESGELRKKPLLMNLTFGTKCDLNCRMCLIANQSNSYYLSHGDFKNLDKTDINDTILKKKYFKNFIFPIIDNVKEVTIAGGEPLVISEVSMFLQECIKRQISKKIQLHLISNFNSDPRNYLRLFSKFRECILDISVDGTEDLYDYIRYPGNWSKLNDNFKMLKSLSDNIHVCFIITVQVYNIFDVCKVVFFVLSLMKDHGKKYSISFNYLYSPEYLCVKNLPSKIKKRAVKKIEKLLDIGLEERCRVAVQDLIKFVNSPKEHNIRRKFLEYTKHLDDKRNQSYKNVLDESIMEWLEKK